MSKIFLVMLEDGRCVFSRMPGNADGVRRTPNFKKKAEKDPRIGDGAEEALPDDACNQELPPAA